MKIVLLAYYNRGDKGSDAPGSVIDVDKAEAARLIEVGAARSYGADDAAKSAAAKAAAEKAAADEAERLETERLAAEKAAAEEAERLEAERLAAEKAAADEAAAKGAQA